MTDRELLQQALDALESWQKTCLDCGRSSEELGRATKSLQAIRTRLAELEPEETVGGWPLYSGIPKPKPVAWSYDNKFNWDVWGDATWQISISQHQERADQIPLYTAPPKKEWVGLTDADLIELVAFTHMSIEDAKSVEAKLKEKNI
jgi:hypothetical protein